MRMRGSARTGASLRRHGVRRRDSFLPTAAALSIGAAATLAQAQEVPDIDGGLTRNQASVAVAIDSILAAGSGTTALEDTLGAVEALPGPARPSAYDNLAHEEVDGHRSLGVRSAAAQTRNLGDRMAELRVGATGVSVANLQLVAPGGGIDGETLASFLPAELRGGGASADGAGLAGRLGVFVNGAIELGDRDATSRRDGLDYSSVALTLGADYRVTDTLVLGAAFGYTDSDGDFDRGGGIEVESYSAQVFGLFYPLENLSVDVLAGTAWLDYDMRRRVAVPGVLTTTARSDTDARQYFVGAGVMYDVPFEGATISPFARLDFQRLEIDGFRERGPSTVNLRVGDQNVNSLTSALGVQASYAISTRIGILQPQLRAQWVHQFEDDARDVNAFFVEDAAGTRFDVRTESPDRNWLDLGASLSLTTIGGLTGFIDYDGTFANDDLDRHRFTAGLRYQF